MAASYSFIDELELDLRRAYLRHVPRRRRLRAVTLAAAVVAVAVVATAGAATGVLGWFGIDQDGAVSIPDPPQLISCSPSGCLLGTATPAPGSFPYVFSHKLGDDLPASGRLDESLPGQGVIGPDGRSLVPPAGAQLAYVCTALSAERIDCTPLTAAGSTLPRGAAIYILSPTAYVP